MKTEKIFFRSVCLLLMVCLLLSGCGAAENTAVVARIAEETVLTTVPTETQPVTETQSVMETTAATAPEAPKQEISVAIYPYVPDQALFQRVLTAQWQEREPEVSLKFVDWNCYDDKTRPNNIDVIMYDALCTTYLAKNQYIQPIAREDIPDAESILPFALEGAMVDGELYGVPYLVCSYFFMNRKDDAALAEAENFSEVYDVVMGRAADDRLLINYNTDYPYHYLDAMIDFTGEYTTYDENPVITPPAAEPMEQLRRIAAMQTQEPELPENMVRDTFYRSKLFCDGHASCYYGYSEDMSFMGNLVDELEIRTISFSEKENIQLFFADIVSMGSHVTDPVKIELCKKLMALIGSEQFQRELCFGTEKVQYMLPARFRIYEEAAKQYPMYGRLYELVMDERNGIFRVGDGIYEYLGVAYDALA